jgi:hypothetical protein
VPESRDDDDFEGDAAPKLSFLQRVRYTMVKPDDDPTSKSKEEELTVEELEAKIATADDRERAVGLVAAPVGALIGLLVSNNLIDHAKTLHQSTSVYETLTYVLLGMSVLMLVAAWRRKRLFLGILLALLGLSLFNLHGYGFAIPFLFAGAWLLVRAYRLQQRLKLATGSGPGAPRRPSRTRQDGVLPRPNKRYTPRTAPAKRPPPPTEKEKRAG